MLVILGCLNRFQASVRLYLEITDHTFDPHSSQMLPPACPPPVIRTIRIRGTGSQPLQLDRVLMFSRLISPPLPQRLARVNYRDPYFDQDGQSAYVRLANPTKWILHVSHAVTYVLFHVPTYRTISFVEPCVITCRRRVPESFLRIFTVVY